MKIMRGCNIDEIGLVLVNVVKKFLFFGNNKIKKNCLDVSVGIVIK